MVEMVWFRNDLRLHDHPGITAAEQSDEPWIGVYVFPERLYDAWLGVERSTVETTTPHRYLQPSSKSR